jgi:hypothetical protein
VGESIEGDRAKALRSAQDSEDEDVKKQVLSPGMQDGKEANLGAKMLRIGRHFEHRFRYRSKE